MGTTFKLDEFIHLDSWLHRWDARYKLVGLFVLIFSFAFVQDLALLPGMLVTTLGLYLMSRLPFSYWRSRFRYPGYFLLGIVIMLPLLSGETVIWQWGIFTIRQEGVLAVLLVAGRFVSILTVVLILLGTTPFLTLVKAMRSLGLPPLLADMMLLTYRYLFDIAENLTTMQQSMRLRGFGAPRQFRRQQSPDGRSPIPDGRHLNRLASLAGTLFVRSYEQSERIYKAMKLRGYGSTPFQHRYQSPHAPSQKASTVLWNRAALGGTLLIATGFLLAEWL